jgi:hypothetical protein
METLDENYRQFNLVDFPEEVGNLNMLCLIEDTSPRTRYDFLGRYNGYDRKTQDLHFTILYFRVKSRDNSNPWVNIFERYDDGHPYDVEYKFDSDRERYISRKLMEKAIDFRMKFNSKDIKSRYKIYGWLDPARAELIPVFFSPLFLERKDPVGLVELTYASSLIMPHEKVRSSEHYTDAKKAIPESYPLPEYKMIMRPILLDKPVLIEYNPNPTYKREIGHLTFEGRKERNLTIYKITDRRYSEMVFIARYIDFVDKSIKTGEVYLHFKILFKHSTRMIPDKNKHLWTKVDDPVRLELTSDNTVMVRQRNVFMDPDLHLDVTGITNDLDTYIIESSDYLDKNGLIEVGVPYSEEMDIDVDDSKEPSSSQEESQASGYMDSVDMDTEETQDSGDMEIGGKRRKSRRRTKRSKKSKRKSERKGRRKSRRNKR